MSRPVLKLAEDDFLAIQYLENATMSVRYKTLLMCLGIGLIPGIVIASIGWYSADNIKNLTASELLSVASNTGDKIDRSLFERYGDVQAFCLNPLALAKDQWYKHDKETKLVALLNSLVDTYDIYTLTMLVDLDGKVIAVNNKDADGKGIDSSFIYQNNYASAPWFRDVVAGRFLTSKESSLTGTAVQDVYIDEDAKRVSRDEGLSLSLRHPSRMKPARRLPIGEM